LAGGGLDQRASRSVAIAVLALVALLLAGCGALSIALDMSSRLGRDGFRDCSVNLNSSNGRDIVEVTTSGHQTLDTEQARDRAAKLVWNELPLRFDEIAVTIGGHRKRVDRQGLEGALGPRNPALDKRSIGQEIGGGFATVGIIVLAVILVVVGLIIWLVVWLVRRDSRRPPPRPFSPGPPPGRYPPGPYPPGPYPPGPPPAGLQGPPPPWR
jgi:hypothetical protein